MEEPSFPDPSGVLDFSFAGQEKIARVCDVIDGDTLEVMWSMCQSNSEFYKFRIRLLGINACELKDKDEVNKDKAHKAHARLFELCCRSSSTSTSGSQSEGTVSLINDIACNITKKKTELRRIIRDHLRNKVVSVVRVKCGDFDSFGRVLAHVYAYFNHSNIESPGINEEKKMSFSEQMLCDGENLVNRFRSQS